MIDDQVEPVELELPGGGARVPELTRDNDDEGLGGDHENELFTEPPGEESVSMRGSRNPP